MANTLDDDLNIVSNSGLEIELLGDDLNIIQALDDEPNDVGGLTSAELKETFDRAGNLIKTYLNEKLVPAILADDATEAARAAAEAARVTAEAARETAEAARAAAEADRVEAEQARVDENTGIVAQATAKATAAADSAAKALNSEENAKAWSEGGYVSEEDADGMIKDTPVPGAKWYAEKAAACANGGSYDPDPTDGTAERTYTSGSKNMADKAKAFAEGGSYKEYVADTSAPGTYNLVTKTVADAESAKGYAQRAELAAIKQPIIQSGTWWVWDADSGAYTDTGVSAGGSGGGTSDQVFIAEYDVTTNADLLAAYQSGKVCFVKYGDQYVPVTIVQADYNSNFVLKGYIIIAESVPGVYVNEVNQTVIVSRYDTGWSIGERALSVDDALSETSENPVQNKVVKSALDAIHVPDKLPNPNALTFTGAVTGSYDGSAPVSVEIPSGGGGYTWEETVLASGTLVADTTVDYDTGITLAMLREYKSFVYRLKGASNVVLANLYLMFGNSFQSIDRADASGRVIVYEWADAAKTVLYMKSGYSANPSMVFIDKNFAWATNQPQGYNVGACSTIRYIDVSALQETDRLKFYCANVPTINYAFDIRGLTK